MGDTVTKFFENNNTTDGYVTTTYPGDIKVTVNSYPFNEVTNKKDKYVQQVQEKFEERSQRGIEKYNTTLERNDLDFIDWLNHLQEELMDATLYIQKLKSEATKNS